MLQLVHNPQGCGNEPPCDFHKLPCICLGHRATGNVAIAMPDEAEHFILKLKVGCGVVVFIQPPRVLILGEGLEERGILQTIWITVRRVVPIQCLTPHQFWRELYHLMSKRRPVVYWPGNVPCSATWMVTPGLLYMNSQKQSREDHS